jgi:Immunity protein 8
VNAEVRRFHSPDVYDLRSWSPPRIDSFAFLLQVLVGPVGGKGEESFDVLVCTPQWLAETLSGDDLLIGRHRLIVKEYSFPRIEQFIRNYVNGCSGDSWEQLAEQVGRLGKWEFEDYRESP